VRFDGVKGVQSTGLMQQRSFIARPFLFRLFQHLDRRPEFDMLRGASGPDGLFLAS
jgi:hypothetical protein